MNLFSCTHFPMDSGQVVSFAAHSIRRQAIPHTLAVVPIKIFLAHPTLKAIFKKSKGEKKVAFAYTRIYERNNNLNTLNIQ